MSVVTSTPHMHRAVKPALLHFDSIVEEPHDSEFFSLNLGKSAVSDDVVAAGDGGEDARLDVHRSIATCVNIVSINLNKQTSREIRVVKLHCDSVVGDD